MTLKIHLPVVSQEMGTQKTLALFLLDGKTFNCFTQALEDHAIRHNERVRKLLTRPTRWR
ncbi:MAG: hypothetical protein ACN6QE_08985 [Pseudomonas putida]